jgi:hypothetical protein
MKKLIILGTGDSIFQPDYDNYTFDIWACGTAFSSNYTKKIKRLDLGFEIHKFDRMVKIFEDAKLLVDYNKYNCPIMVQDQDDKLINEYIEKPITFPIDEVLKFGGKRFYTSTFSYMIVYAAMMGYKDISLYQLLMSADKEYVYEVPCVEYWCNLLTQRENINFSIPEDSELFSSYKLYGYEEYKNQYKVMSRNRWLWEKFDRNLCDYEKMLADLQKNLGVKQTLELLRNNPPADKIQMVYEESCKKSNEIAGKIQNTINDMNLQKGALQIASFYKNMIE